MSDPIGDIWGLKSGELQPTNFASTEAGLVAAIAHATTNGRVIVGPLSLSISSAITLPSGLTLTLAGGTYTLEGSGSFSLGPFSTLEGLGYGATSIAAGTTFSAAFMIANATQDGTQQACFVRNLELNGNKATATVAKGIYMKGIGQPSHIRDVVVYNVSGTGIWIEGVASSAFPVCLENVWVNRSDDHNIYIKDPCQGLSMNHVSSEFPGGSGKACIYFDGTSAATRVGPSWLTDIHIEGLEAGETGILFSNWHDATVNGIMYAGSGGTGDLIKITGAATDSYNIQVINAYDKFSALDNTINDVTNSVTLADAVPYYNTGAVRILGTATLSGVAAIGGNATVGGTLGVTGASTLTGNVTAQGAANTFGTSGVAQTTTIGRGGTSTDTAVMIVDSGSGAGAQARATFRRNSTTDMSIFAQASLQQITFRDALQFANILGTAAAYMTTGGKLRLGDGTPPTQQLEIVGSPLFSALTSGKYPKISTGGLIIDGPTPLAGTKVYYVSDSSGGAVTRKLTFTDGILTAET